LDLPIASDLRVSQIAYKTNPRLERGFVFGGLKLQ